MQDIASGKNGVGSNFMRHMFAKLFRSSYRRVFNGYPVNHRTPLTWRPAKSIQPQAIKVIQQDEQESKPYFFNFANQLSLEHYVTNNAAFDKLYCLQKLRAEWAKDYPLLGKRVLLNFHMTQITLLVIDILRAAGAYVDVTASPELATHKDTLDVIKESGITFYPNGDIPVEKHEGFYDIVYDCGAFMQTTIKPNAGMVELTHTDPECYTESTFPTITVDSSDVKIVETTFGTGNSLVRLLTYLAQEAVSNMARIIIASDDIDQQNFANSSRLLKNVVEFMEASKLFKCKKYMVIGYGKVGKGIASALQSAGVLNSNIIIIDRCTNAIMRAKADGYAGYILTETDRESIDIIKQHIEQMYAVITATGNRDVISQYFDLSDFNNVHFLIGMSTYDDWGPKFPITRVQNAKKPANFMLAEPTESIYLDPVFALLIIAGETLLTQSLSPGLHPVSKEMDDAMLSDWLKQHDGNIWQHTQHQASLISLLTAIQGKDTITEQNLSQILSSANKTLVGNKQC